MSSTCRPQYGELRPISGWDRFSSLGYPCKFQLVSRLGSVTARNSSSGRQSTLHRWTEGATYIRQGDHHVGHWPRFLVFNILAPSTKFRHCYSVYTTRASLLSRSFRHGHPIIHGGPYCKLFMTKMVEIQYFNDRDVNIVNAALDIITGETLTCHCEVAELEISILLSVHDSVNADLRTD